MNDHPYRAAFAATCATLFAIVPSLRAQASAVSAPPPVMPAFTAAQSDSGATVYATKCAACHGTFGEGAGRYPRIAGQGKLTGERPEETVGSFWPYATTLFDYINRAMPFPSPHVLPPDQVYALTAYVLNLNGLVDDNFVADAKSLPLVKMPNRDNFIPKDFNDINNWKKRGCKWGQCPD